MNLVQALQTTHGEVRKTPEFERVLELPRRGELPPDLARGMTELLGGVDMTLWDGQAQVLLELEEVGGCLASLPVGYGKTAITYLAPMVAKAKNALLLIPAKLREKTRRDFSVLAKHWPRATAPRVESYEMLSNHQDLLERLEPDLIVCDECQKLRNLQAGCTRRFIRYLRKHECGVVAMSGTITSRSLLDLWHLLLATHKDRMPLPRSRAETAMWARAVDEKVEIRSRPGALTLLSGGKTLPEVRAAVGNRIFDTPGCVRRETAGVAASIYLSEFIPKRPEEVRKPIARLLKDKIAPNGDECTPADVWRHLRTLILEFAYIWDPPPPKEWMIARKRWKRFARGILEAGDPKYDTELQVARGCSRDELPRKAYDAWAAVRGTFMPNSVPRWYSDTVLRELANRTMDGKGGDSRSLVWVEHVAIGRKLSQLTGWPYYHAQGMCEKRYIEDHDPASGPAIVSIAANCEGRNLQAWSRNLIVTPPASGLKWEQLLGRTHRPGQLADHIDAEVVIGHPRVRDDIMQAYMDAEYVRDTTGQPQKLLLADGTLDVIRRGSAVASVP